MTRASGPAPRLFRPAPAVADRHVRWPADFGTRLIVTVDTEEEFDWDQPLDRANRSTRAIAQLPAAHQRFAAHGVAPIYLVDHPVATSPTAVAILADLLRDGVSAIGTQLHPWVTPPFDEEVTSRNSFQGNLPRALEAAKIAEATRAVRDAFSIQPLLFRAGRYGLGADSLALIAAAGYRIDSSVRARYDYSDVAGPDYRAIGNAAWHVGDADGLVSLPLTTVFTGRLRGAGPDLYPALARIPRARGIASRLGLLSRVALTPEDMPLGDALEAVRVAVGEGVRLLNFSFHSPTVAPGHTSFVRDAAALDAFHRWWDAVFALADRLGVRPATHDQLIEALDRAG